MQENFERKESFGYRQWLEKAFTFTHDFLRRLEDRADIRDSVEYLRIWYEAYERLMLYIGTVAVSILVFTATFLLKDYVSGTYAGKLQIADLASMKRSIIFLGICLLFVALNFVSTYNWFAHGLNHALKQTGLKLRTAGESFQYRERMGSMSFWGYASLVTGYGAGIALLTALFFYVRAAWRVLNALLQHG